MTRFAGSEQPISSPPDANSLRQQDFTHTYQRTPPPPVSIGNNMRGISTIQKDHDSTIHEYDDQDPEYTILQPFLNFKR